MTDPTIKLFIEHVSVASWHHGFNRDATEDEMIRWLKTEFGEYYFSSFWIGDLHCICSKTGIAFDDDPWQELPWKKLAKEVCAAIREEETEQIRMVF